MFTDEDKSLISLALPGYQIRFDDGGKIAVSKSSEIDDSKMADFVHADELGEFVRNALKAVFDVREEAVEQNFQAFPRPPVTKVAIIFTVTRKNISPRRIPFAD